MLTSRSTSLVSSFAFLLALVATLSLLPSYGTATAWAAGREPIEIQGDVVRPKVLKPAKPVYPGEERAQRIGGAVTLKAVITEEGKVKDPEVVKSSGSKNLDQSAVKCFKKWTFQPATLKGEPVAVYYYQIISFSVADQ